MSDERDEGPDVVAWVTREQFRADVVELVMAAQVSQSAPLLLSGDSRAEILKRSARLAVQVAHPLWMALAELPVCDDDGLRMRTAIRCLAQLVGWHADLAHRGPEDRQAIIAQSVRAAVGAGQSAVDALGERYP